jgi:3-oxoacyl-[acyl-carrier protein] reductase
MDISGKRILITGGAGNFGQFLCNHFLTLDVGKVILIDLDFHLVDDQIKNSSKVDLHICDLRKSNEVSSLVSTIFAEGPVDVLINNAGYIHSEPLINLLNRDNPVHSIEQWNKTITLNLTTCFTVSGYVASHMAKKRSGGVIINVSSIAAKGNMGQTAYSAAKAGIEAMTKVWSKELGMFKIRVACIAPGFIDTPSTHGSLSEVVVDRWKKSVSIGRLGKLEEIGTAIQFIIQNDYVNGTVISIDGGLTI